MEDYHKKVKYLGLKPNSFEPSNENEIIKSNDLVEAIYKIEENINQNNILFIQGGIGSGKSTIKNRAIWALNSYEIKLVSISPISEKIKISNLYTAALLEIDERIKLSKKIVDRQDQLIKTLSRLNYNKISLFIDNCDKINSLVLNQLFDFKNNFKDSLSIVLFGKSLDTNYKINKFKLRCLTADEKKLYLKILHNKTDNILPYSLPETILKKADNYFDIINQFVDFSFKIKKGLIKY